MTHTSTTTARRRSLWAEWVAHALPYVLFAAAMLLLDSIGRAATQEEFFRSMQQSVSSGPGGGSGEITARGLATFLGVVGLIVAVAVLVHRVHRRLSNRRHAPPRPLSSPTSINQPKKLAKEIARAAGLSGEEMRQLKAAAEQQGHASPLTLLICPSLLIDAARKDDTTADKSVLTRIARRMIAG